MIKKSRQLRETSHFFFCAVQGLLFRGVIFRGYSGCMYLETVQYGCFCLKIPEIVPDIYIGTVQTLLEPISVYRTYKRTNALTRLLWYKVHARTVSIRAEPSDERTRVQLILEESLPDQSFHAPLLRQTSFDALASRSSYEDSPA